MWKFKERRFFAEFYFKLLEIIIMLTDMFEWFRSYHWFCPFESAFLQHKYLVFFACKGMCGSFQGPRVSEIIKLTLISTHRITFFYYYIVRLLSQMNRDATLSVLYFFR